MEKERKKKIENGNQNEYSRELTNISWFCLVGDRNKNY